MGVGRSGTAGVCDTILYIQADQEAESGSRSGYHSQNLPPTTHIYLLDLMTQRPHNPPIQRHQLGTRVPTVSPWETLYMQAIIFFF